MFQLESAKCSIQMFRSRNRKMHAIHGLGAIILFNNCYDKLYAKVFMYNRYSNVLFR